MINKYPDNTSYANIERFDKEFIFRINSYEDLWHLKQITEVYQHGWKYRGRGFNQLTGRANYTNEGKAIGIDLVNNPDLLDTPQVAAKALAHFLGHNY